MSTNKTYAQYRWERLVVFFLTRMINLRKDILLRMSAVKEQLTDVGRNFDDAIASSARKVAERHRDDIEATVTAIDTLTNRLYGLDFLSLSLKMFGEYHVE